MLDAMNNYVSSGPATAAAPRHIQRAERTHRVGLAMMAALDATEALRQCLEQRGDDADAIMGPLDRGISETWEAIG